MAGTCTFTVNDDIHENIVCFAELTRSFVKKAKVVILISPKLQKEHGFTRDEINTYLDDLLKMGFLFDYSIIDDVYHVNIHHGNTKVQCIALGMAIRYLWEISSGIYCEDNFYHTIIHFNKLEFKICDSKNAWIFLFFK